MRESFPGLPYSMFDNGEKHLDDYFVVMSLGLLNSRLEWTAPIPHQFAMKVYVDTWIYVTEKYANMGFIELYKGILRYETGI